MYVRLAFAVAAHLEPEILLVDEVLAVGDAEFQRRCLGRMREIAGEGRTVVFVTHDLAVVRASASAPSGSAKGGSSRTGRRPTSSDGTSPTPGDPDRSIPWRNWSTGKGRPRIPSVSA